jgi:TPR repeat protein
LLGCVDLGVYYAQGIGVAQDMTKAIELWRRACNGGIAGGCMNLGMAYDQGFGVTRDAAQAAALYRKACQSGEPRGCAKAK